MLLCTACLAPVWETAGSFRCVRCGTAYRSLRGIPDLRASEDAYLPNRDDWALALTLDRDFDRLDFRGLLARYYELCPEVPPDRRDVQIAHILSAPERSEPWMAALGPAASGDGPILDLGCGPGAFLAARAGRGGTWWGVDIAMRWLVLARKRLDEAGLGGVRLACGCAEALPFADRTFAAVVGGDVIEHVRSAEAALSESHRVLRPGGRLFLATPNRFSLGPEPHVGLLGVGYLPRPLMRPYVRWRRKDDFRAIHTRGFGEWKRLARRSPFGGATIVPPPIPPRTLAPGPGRFVAGLYNAAVSCAAGRWLLRRVGPVLHLVCDRPAEAPAEPFAGRPHRQQRHGQGNRRD